MILICGPCSAENLSQLSDIAKSLKSVPIDYFRAGLWKPRTRPDGFEGIGNKGLQWMKDIKKEYGYKICTEVANVDMAELCLEYGFDAVWIGARTTQNPFLVEQIADVFAGSGITVMVKNPLNPDIHLWVGAIERFEKKNIHNIIAIHRGFSLTYNMYRQSPLWRIPLELKLIRKDIPLVCDPSHIAGDRKYVKEIAYNAITTGFDGLMIEVHNNPDKALTDANQQIDISQLTSIITDLPKVSLDNKHESQILLKSLREQINEVDDTILNALSERMHISRQIAQVKKTSNMAVFQPERWCEVLNKLLISAEKKNIQKDFIKEIYEIIHQESIKEQNLIINKSNNYSL